MVVTMVTMPPSRERQAEVVEDDDVGDGEKVLSNYVVKVGRELLYNEGSIGSVSARVTGKRSERA